MSEDSAKRYAAACLTAPSVPFTAFTEPAREAVVLARGEAHALGESGVGTEHLLLGLLQANESLAAAVLFSLKVTSESVLERVARMGQTDPPAVAAEEILVIPRSRKVLECALREAIVLGFSAAGTEHLLLALSAEQECVAAGILRELVTDGELGVRNAVIQALSDTYPETLRTNPVPFQKTPRYGPPLATRVPRP